MTTPTQANRRRASNVVLGAILIAVLAALLAAQGGFSDLAAGLAGAVLSTAALAGLLVSAVRRRVGIRPYDIAGPLLLAAIGVSACASAFAHGASLSMVASACPWFSAAAAAMVAALLPDEWRGVLLEALCWVGIASALLAIISALTTGAALGGAISSRLQFPFQYANSAGMWYAAVAILALFSERRSLRYLALVPVCAMLLTQSVGAIGTFLLGVCAASAIRAKSGHLHERDKWVPVAASIALVCLACAGAVVLAPGRAMQASQTFIERIVQIADGARMLSAEPLLGVGPDVWGLSYPFMQSAQYQANAIHCGYLQVALDSGVIGLAALIAYAILGVRGALKGSQPVRAIAICMMLLHVALDFDFEFSALLLFFVIVCESSRKSGLHTVVEGNDTDFKIAPSDENPGTSSTPKTILACAGTMCLCLAACSIGAFCAHAVQVAYEAGIAGDVEAVLKVVESTPLAEADTSVQTSLYAALQQSGKADEIEGRLDDYGIRSGEQALLAASGLFRAERDEQASIVLISELEREPYNVELFDQAAKLFEHFGIGEPYADCYKAAVDAANEAALRAHEFWHLDQISDLPYGYAS